jgi:hypothetical protein
MILIEWSLLGILVSIWIVGLGLWFSLRNIENRLIFIDRQAQDIKNKLS